MHRPSPTCKSPVPSLLLPPFLPRNRTNTTVTANRSNRFNRRASSRRCTARPPPPSCRAPRRRPAAPPPRGRGRGRGRARRQVRRSGPSCRWGRPPAPQTWAHARWGACVDRAQLQLPTINHVCAQTSPVPCAVFASCRRTTQHAPGVPPRTRTQPCEPHVSKPCSTPPSASLCLPLPAHHCLLT